MSTIEYLNNLVGLLKEGIIDLEYMESAVKEDEGLDLFYYSPSLVVFKDILGEQQFEIHC